MTLVSLIPPSCTVRGRGSPPAWVKPRLFGRPLTVRRRHVAPRRPVPVGQDPRRIERIRGDALRVGARIARLAQQLVYRLAAPPHDPPALPRPPPPGWRAPAPGAGFGLRGLGEPAAPPLPR